MDQLRRAGVTANDTDEERTRGSAPVRARSRDGADRQAHPAIHVSGVEKTYRTTSGDRIQALSRIDLEISDGEFIAVVGPSGCGKTTLLKILSGLLGFGTGTVNINGTPLNGPRPDIGIVFQTPVLLPWRTILENVLVIIEARGLDKGSYRQTAQELLTLAGLEGFEDKYPSELSGGMQQRASIVRSLVHDPAILLMDEPFGALDAMTREQMNVELLRIWDESRKTVFFITHSIPEAVFLADRVVVMSPRPGRIVEDLRVDLPRPRTIELMGDSTFVDHVQRIRHLLMTKGGID